MSQNESVTARRGWVPVRTARDQLEAEMWRERLDSLAIPAVVAPADVSSYLGITPVPCRVLVPAHLRAAAEHVLAEAP
jgi:Putative prokaryotic signal transducing protein